MAAPNSGSSSTSSDYSDASISPNSPTRIENQKIFMNFSTTNEINKGVVGYVKYGMAMIGIDPIQVMIPFLLMKTRRREEL